MFEIPGFVSTVVVDMGYSFTRMFLAFLLSLGFAIGYGYYAATNHVAEKVLLPILDILQSVPILGFFPFAIGVFVMLTPGSPIGANMASIFLIFTSMSWNMAFGVYESIKTLPSDLSEVGNSYSLHGWLRFRKLLFPAMANRLIYNTVLSWATGWYYLVACEIITTAATSQSLPGIGSYLLLAAASGNTNEILAGVIVLVLVVIALDLGVWAPLGKIAERYRFDTSPSGNAEADVVAPFRRVRYVVGRAYAGGASFVRTVRQPFTRGRGPESRRTPVSPSAYVPRKPKHPLLYAALTNVAIGSALVIGWFLLIEMGANVYKIYTAPISPTVWHYLQLVPEALGLSIVRVVAAYFLSLAIALPLAIYLFRHATARKWGLPAIQIVASIPATALFPLFLFSLKDYIGTEGAILFVIVTGMIWYLFFNLLSGLRTIPPDLEESSKSLGLKGSKLYRRLILPGTFSAFVTGSITAMGGGWNTLIIAEYLTYGHKSIQALGLGYLIDIGTYGPQNGGIANGLPVMVAAVLTLVVTVIIVNKVVWKPLYRLAAEKYRYD